MIQPIMGTTTAQDGWRTSDAVDAAAGLFAALGEALLCLDEDFTIVYASPFLDRLLGRPSAERIRSLPAEVVFGEDVFGPGSHHRTVLHAEGRAARVPATLRPGDGSGRPVVLEIARVESPEGPRDGGIAWVIALRAAVEEADSVGNGLPSGTDPEGIRIRQALEAHRWRREEAAHALGISRTTLWRKMREYGLL